MTCYPRRRSGKIYNTLRRFVSNWGEQTLMPSSRRRTPNIILSMLALSIATGGLALTGACAPASTPENTDNWPGWLGPLGMPVADNPDLPDRWSPTENIEWAADVPGEGWSSPVVWGNRVFLTAATSDMPMKQPSYGVDFSNDYIAELQEQGLEMEEIIELTNQRDNIDLCFG